MPKPKTARCRICAAPSPAIGSKPSRLRKATYQYHACPRCGFAFISNPWTDYAKVYDAAYYRGQGGDPGIDYAFELSNPSKSVRRYEYAGLLELGRHLTGRDNFRWLDYGCGHGGLVTHLNAHSAIDAQGFEEGSIAKQARAQGAPILSRAALAKHAGRYDLVSAIEVIEHSPDPLGLLRQLRRLLKPGGVLLLTTGNAEPHKKSLLRWSYASAPDVHVSFFTPKSLRLAYAKAGLEPLSAGYAPGLTRVIQYKVLKTLGMKKGSAWIRLLPWGLIARVVDRRYQVSKMPLARRA